MHELSIAQALVDTVIDGLPAYAGRRVLSLQLELGEHSGVQRDALEFCFDEVARGTVLEGARLCVRDVPLQLACAACEAREPPGQFAALCSACGSPRLDAIAGREIMVRSLELEGTG